MKVLAPILIPFSLASCGSRSATADLCELAQRPSSFVGKELLVKDILVQAGHSAAFVPNSSCPEFTWFTVGIHELEPVMREQFVRQFWRLNIVTVNGHRPGLAGAYKVRVEGRVDPGVVNLSLLEAAGMRIVAADEQSRAIDREMGKPPPDFS